MTHQANDTLPIRRIRPGPFRTFATGLAIGLLLGAPILIGFIVASGEQLAAWLVAAGLGLLVLTAVMLALYMARGWLEERTTRRFSEWSASIEDSARALGTDISTCLTSNGPERMESAAALSERMATVGAKAIYIRCWNAAIGWAFKVTLAVFLAITGGLGAALVIRQNDLIEKQNETLEAHRKLLASQNGNIKLQNRILADQGQLVDAQLLATTRAGLFAQSRSIQRTLIERPELYPYLYEGRALDESATSDHRVAVLTLVEMLADVIDHAASSRLQETYAQEGWRQFAIDTFESSPELKKFLERTRDWYPFVWSWLEMPSDD